MSDNQIPMQEEIYYVDTIYDHYNCFSKNNYEFNSKDEFLKFVNGERATDRYGDNHTQSYYETIQNAYVKAEIDVIALKEKSLEGEQERE